MADTAKKAEEEIANMAANAGSFIEKNKPLVIGIGVGAAIFIILCCYCCIKCRMKKKKKKDAEKQKLKGNKESKKMKRIQPSKSERKVMEELGTIKFSLSYDILSEFLTVKVKESEDIPVRDLSGYAYSYVVIKVLPLHEHDENVYKTNFVRGGYYPAYGDSFNFQVPKEGLSEQVIYLYQYELNRWSKQDGIGQLTYEIKRADLLKEKVGEVTLTKKLKPYDPLLGLEKETGAVFLAMEYDRENWELKIEIRQADIIPEDEDKDKCHSYVTLTMLNKDGEKIDKRKSRSKGGTLQPLFEDEVSFSIPDNILPDAKLLVKLKMKRMLRPTMLIGKYTILSTNDNWKKLVDTEYTEGWFSMMNKPKVDK
ncbi:synaptotagmin-2-like isoform X2 [Clytia hemisphaerica]|uniref:C2 domain-containing protein n=1 Tax=Clytia hemisphaerica TaxID=252671 RepID=A0A7M6DNN4_9CNID